MGRNVLFKTVHGSRLYGLSGPDSDWDFYEVVEKVPSKKAKFSLHKIVGSKDTKTFDFGTFSEQAKAGVPQALEAMFSTKATVDRIGDFRRAFVYAGGYGNYLGTINHLYEDHPDSYKHKRHMLRLAVNMKGLRHHGRFDPTLTPVQVALVNSLARLPADAVYNDALALAWS